MYKLVFFVPVEYLETVKEAVFKAGAGRMGDYDRCCWQSLGEGQFRPLSNSKPFLGTQGRLETVQEYRVEMICPENAITNALSALKEAHPYEDPAYDIIKLYQP